MQIRLLRKRFLANVTLVSTFTGVTLFVLPPATVLAECFHAYAAFVDFFGIAGCCDGSCIICLRMMNHSMSGQLLFIIEILRPFGNIDGKIGKSYTMC